MRANRGEQGCADFALICGLVSNDSQDNESAASKSAGSLFTLISVDLLANYYYLLLLSYLTKRSVNEDITLYILFEAYPEYEHWAVRIGDAYLQAAASYEEWTSALDKSTLHLPIWRGNEKAQFSPAPRMVKLGTAKFKNDQEKEAIINGILDWKHMSMPVTEPGGNCMDFIRYVLEDLSRQKHAKKSVLQKFMEEYQAKYTGVVEAVVGMGIIISQHQFFYRKEALKILTKPSTTIDLISHALIVLGACFIVESYCSELLTSSDFLRVARWELQSTSHHTECTCRLQNAGIRTELKGSQEDSLPKDRGARELWFFGFELEEKRSEGPREYKWGLYAYSTSTYVRQMYRYIAVIFLQKLELRDVSRKCLREAINAPRSLCREIQNKVVKNNERKKGRRTSTRATFASEYWEIGRTEDRIFFEFLQDNIER
ncbi:hypothetical protein F5050DRAFT_1715320 [Lentinula boryana]|uniref:Uncharacterized protein n=1 Tax=Lentinula boryana TaxID=40481 RepID=A0ABQ8Q1N1_9AGAR|nr:hypothetical protein F5050DRAFT_1715320 [Lentinula boryana]